MFKCELDDFIPTDFQGRLDEQLTYRLNVEIVVIRVDVNLEDGTVTTL